MSNRWSYAKMNSKQNNNSNFNSGDMPSQNSSSMVRHSLSTVKNINVKTRPKGTKGPWEPRKRGEPGGIDDERRKGLSGSGVRWYLKYLIAGLDPDIARAKAEEHKTKQPDPLPKTKKNSMRDTSIKVAVFPKKYPHLKLTSKELYTLEEAIIEEIAQVQVAPKLQFINIHRKDGRLLAECLNEPTASWLIGVIPKLSNWNGTGITSCREEEFSIHRHTVNIILPQSAGQDHNKSLALIDSQNEHLNIDFWSILESLDEYDTQELKISIDDISLKQIQRQGDIISYRFGKVPVSKLSDEDNAEKVEEQDKAAEEQTEEAGETDELNQ